MIIFQLTECINLKGLSSKTVYISSIRGVMNLIILSIFITQSVMNSKIIIK